MVMIPNSIARFGIFIVLIKCCTVVSSCGKSEGEKAGLTFCECLREGKEATDSISRAWWKHCTDITLQKYPMYETVIGPTWKGKYMHELSQSERAKVHRFFNDFVNSRKKYCR